MGNALPAAPLRQSSMHVLSSPHPCMHGRPVEGVHVRPHRGILCALHAQARKGRACLPVSHIASTARRPIHQRQAARLAKQRETGHYTHDPISASVGLMPREHCRSATHFVEPAFSDAHPARQSRAVLRSDEGVNLIWQSGRSAAGGVPTSYLANVLSATYSTVIAADIVQHPVSRSRSEN